MLTWIKTLTVCGVLLGASAALATVVERFDLTRLVKTAELIVVGEVIGAQPRWRDGRIVTTVKVRNDGALKGSGEAVVELEVLGGEIDGIAQRVEGMAAFTPGERITVFLQKSTRGAWQTVGLSQGKLRLEIGLTGPKWVRQFDGLALVARQNGKWARVQPTLPAEVSVQDFLIRLNTALAEPPAQP